MNAALPTDKATPDFVRQQQAFAAHIRDPRGHPAPHGIDARRMAIYRELFFNNIEGFISSAYPVLHSLYSEAQWLNLVQHFFSRHNCRTPLFPEVAQEFLHYLIEEHEADPADPPFLNELAHYEWVELALSFSDIENDMRGIDPQGDLLQEIPVLSPLAWPLSYHYPVHRISRDFQPQQPLLQHTHLVVYRDQDDEVQFMEINAVTSRLLQLMDESPEKNGRQLLERIAQEMHHPRPEVVIQGGHDTLLELRRCGILPGTQKQRP